MKILVDDALGQAYKQQVEALVRGVLLRTQGTAGLQASVVRLKEGAWHVFLREEDAGQWSVLPSPAREDLAREIEVALEVAGL